MKLGVRGKLFLITTSVFVIAISVSGLLLSQTLRDYLFKRAEAELTHMHDLEPKEVRGLWVALGSMAVLLALLVLCGGTGLILWRRHP